MINHEIQIMVLNEGWWEIKKIFYFYFVLKYKVLNTLVILIYPD